MTIVLAGGGTGPGIDAALERFLAAVRDRAAGSARAARIAIVAVGQGARPDEHAAWWVERVRQLAPTGVETTLALGRTDDDDRVIDAVALADLLGVDGVLVGGGHTPSYLAALEPVAVDLRRLASEGVPWFGFSAGAAIVADRALVGGWRVGGVAVCPEEAGEDLDEVTVEAGIGLLDLAIDAHAAQWGTLGRVIAAVEAGLVDRALAIDEDTALVVGPGGLDIVGAGSVWQVQAGDGGVTVSSGRAS